MQDTCNNCGRKIEVAIFRGSGHCSELCRKALEEKPKKAKKKRR